MDKARGFVYIGGEKVDEGRLLVLKSEAEAFKAMDLYKLMYETPKRLAEKAMFTDDGKLESQLLKGRAILYTLDTQKTILDTFMSVRKKEPLTSNPKGMV